MTTYAKLEAKAKLLSQRGLKLALWQEPPTGHWHWQWAFMSGGSPIIITEGHTDAAAKPVALAFALNSI
jgi:hypothetical protein